MQHQFTNSVIVLRDGDQPDAAGQVHGDRYAIIPFERYERLVELAEAQAAFLARLIIGREAREPRPEQIHCMKRPNPR